MKVLITGGTPTQCNSKFRRIDYYCVPHALNAALKSAGHEVDWRAPGDPAEDARSYDAVLVGIPKLSSVAAGRVYPALELVHRRVITGQQVGLYFNDWDVKGVIRDLENFAKKPEALTGRPIFAGRIPADMERVLSTIRSLARGNWPPRLFAGFDWGDKRIILKDCPFNSAVIIDPTPLIPQYVPVIDWAGKRRTHIMAALWDHSRWVERMGPTWPVYTMHKRFKNVQPEPDTVRQQYATAWSVFSPPYYHRGSGMWRSRYGLAAQAGALLTQDPADSAPMGAEYRWDLTLLESQSEHALEDVAERQRAWLTAATWTEDHLTTIVDSFIRLS